MDWEKWMDQHHVKLGSDPNDCRENESSVGGGISGRKVAEKTQRDGRPTDRGSVQDDGSNRKIVPPSKTETERAWNSEGSAVKYV